MDQANAEDYQPFAPVPRIQTAVDQNTIYNQPRAPNELGPQRTQNLPSVDVTCQQQPLPQAMNNMQTYCVLPMLVGFSQGGPIRFPPNETQILLFMAMTSTQAPQTPLRTLDDNQRILAGPQRNGRPTLSGNSGDLTARNMQNSSSSLPQEVAVAHSSMKPTDTIQKRELRLLKNREAARECRRKKKEYVKCLENRVAVLENQNKALIEELRALEDINRHKVE